MKVPIDVDDLRVVESIYIHKYRNNIIDDALLESSNTDFI